MSIFIYYAPEILNIILILAAQAEGLQRNQAFEGDYAESASFPFHLGAVFL